MIHSGIAPLDEHLGGLVPNRVHLLTGGPGTGKSTACLQFLHAGLRQGEAVALITLDRCDDLVSHARSISLDLEAPLRTRRLLLLRFSTVFGSVLESGGSPDQMIEDLSRLIAEIRPLRLVVDPLTPFLAERSASGSALGALTRMLEELSLTTIITYPGDVADGYDARLDAVVQRAAAIIHLARDDGGANRMRIVQARSAVASSQPIHFVFRAGEGIVKLDQAKKTPRARGVTTKATTERVQQREPTT